MLCSGEHLTQYCESCTFSCLNAPDAKGSQLQQVNSFPVGRLGKLEGAMKEMVATAAESLGKAQEGLAARVADTFTILW